MKANNNIYCIINDIYKRTSMVKNLMCSYKEIGRSWRDNKDILEFSKDMIKEIDSMLKKFIKEGGLE